MAYDKPISYKPVKPVKNKSNNQQNNVEEKFKELPLQTIVRNTVGKPVFFFLKEYVKK